jgi:hypothetical protein
MEDLITLAVLTTAAALSLGLALAVEYFIWGWLLNRMTTGFTFGRLQLAAIGNKSAHARR